MKSSKYSQADVFAEINITPLVDVMLVLVVIFIITAPLISPQAIKINLPKTQSVAKQERGLQMQLVVQSNGKLVLGDLTVTDKELVNELKKVSANSEFQLQIQADKAVPYGRIAEIMALAQGASVLRLSFVTLPDSKNAK
jgi:biopolymer transport protein ExbD